MSIQLPSQPWQEGDTFTNDATGVEYTFDGVKWLASGGEETEIDSYVRADVDTDITPTVDDLFVTLKTKRPKDAGGNFTDSNFGLAVDLDEGNTYKNQFEVTSRHGYALRVLGGGGREVWVGGSLSQKDGNKDNPNPENYVTRQNLDDRVDDIEAVLPSNASEAVNIGNQTLEVTGSRPTGTAGKPGVMQVWKSETGGPANPHNEAKFICPDTSAIDLSSNALWLKQGNTIQKWNTAGGGWFTSGNVLHVSATTTEGDALVDGQPVELYYSDPDSPLLEVISKEESKADDQLLQDQIDSHTHDQAHEHDEYATLIDLEELQVEVDALATTREAGRWTALSSGAAPRPGEVQFATLAMAARNQIVINETDLDGTVHKFAGLEVGDYVEVVQESGDRVGVYGLHLITADEGGEGVRSLLTDPYQSNGNLSSDNTVFIKIFHANNDLDMAELDARYAYKDHVHSTYFPIGDWSDSEYDPYADLREMDDSYTLLYEANKKAQQITDGAQNKRLDALEESVDNLGGGDAPSLPDGSPVVKTITIRDLPQTNSASPGADNTFFPMDGSGMTAPPDMASKIVINTTSDDPYDLDARNGTMIAPSIGHLLIVNENGHCLLAWKIGGWKKLDAGQVEITVGQPLHGDGGWMTTGTRYNIVLKDV